MLTLEQMTPEQKLGRVIMSRQLGNQDDIDFTVELIKNSACGAVQMTFGPRREELIKLFRDAADYPLLMINDMEHGYPMSNLPKLPLATLAAANNPEYTRMFAAALAKEAKENGFNGCWGPVIDIILEDRPCTVSRVAGDSADAVFEVTKEIFKTFDSYNFQSTGKHYPGEKGMPYDSHMVAPHSQITKEEILKTSLVPYLKLMKEGLLRTVMVGHHICDNIDPGTPSSLSKKVIDIIREQGFDGVMYTDSLAMMSILQTFGEKEAYAMALMAGNDLLLPNFRTPMRDVYNMMLESYREGKITDERLDEAVRRVMALEQYCARVPENPVPVPENIGEILKMAARDAVTADCAEGVDAAIDPEKRRLFVVVTPMDFNGKDEEGEVTITTQYTPALALSCIKKNFPNAEIELIPEYPSSADNLRVLKAAQHHDDIVVVSYCYTAPYLGTDCLTRRIEAVIDALSMPGKLEALVHFGNPLALNNLLPIDRKLLVYSSPESLPYAFEILAGKYPAKGKNPYPKLYHPKKK